MKYDAITIGAGQAGPPLSFALADHGWNVVLIEKSNLGGTCINTGCTPTKTMVHRAQVAHYARNAARWGVVARDVAVDLPEVVAQKQKVVQSFRDGQQRKIDQRRNLRLIRGSASFVGPHSVKVGGEVLESDRIFVNAGARPAIPSIPGLDAVPYLTNETIMELNALPQHLLVLGGGYIGLEFGQMFARFGSRVTVIQSNAQIVPREDPEVASELQKSLEAEGIRFLLNAKTGRVIKDESGIVLSIEQDGKAAAVSGSHLLVAAGRRPNTEDLGLAKAGIETNKDGTIKVNGKLETNVRGVWALGDVKGGPAFVDALRQAAARKPVLRWRPGMEARSRWTTTVPASSPPTAPRANGNAAARPTTTNSSWNASRSPALRVRIRKSGAARETNRPRR